MVKMQQNLKDIKSNKFNDADAKLRESLFQSQKDES